MRIIKDKIEKFKRKCQNYEISKEAVEIIKELEKIDDYEAIMKSNDIDNLLDQLEHLIDIETKLINNNNAILDRFFNEEKNGYESFSDAVKKRKGNTITPQKTDLSFKEAVEEARRTHK